MNEEQGFGVPYQEMTGMKRIRGDWARAYDSYFDKMAVDQTREFLWSNLKEMFGSGGSGGVDDLIDFEGHDSWSLSGSYFDGGLVVLGGPEARKAFQNMVAGGTGGAYGATVDPTTGQITIVPLDPTKSMTSQQAAFYDAIKEAADIAKKRVTIGLVEGSAEVAGGSYPLGQIDMQDMKSIGTKSEVITCFAALGHEITEQTVRQRNNHQYYGMLYYKQDHEYAIRNTEDKVTGASRLIPDRMINKWPKNSLSTGTVQMRFIQGNHLIVVSLYVYNGNIIAVTSSLFP